MIFCKKAPSKKLFCAKMPFLVNFKNKGTSNCLIWKFIDYLGVYLCPFIKNLAKKALLQIYVRKSLP